VATEKVRKQPTITGHNIWNFLECLGKIISVPFLKVAFSRGKVGRPSKPYIPGKSGMQGPTPAEIGRLNTNLS
jgi:hypothetical protein